MVTGLPHWLQAGVENLTISLIDFVSTFIFKIYKVYLFYIISLVYNMVRVGSYVCAG